jgi:hypothetical protein
MVLGSKGLGMNHMIYIEYTLRITLSIKVRVNLLRLNMINRGLFRGPLSKGSRRAFIFIRAGNLYTIYF